VLVSIAGFTSDARSQTQASGSMPNILFIVADDQGWNDLSVPMDDDIPGSKNDFNRIVIFVAASRVRI